jgi:hypothetical protein
VCVGGGACIADMVKLHRQTRCVLGVCVCGGGGDKESLDHWDKGQHSSTKDANVCTHIYHCVTCDRGRCGGVRFGVCVGRCIAYTYS